MNSRTILDLPHDKEFIMSNPCSPPPPPPSPNECFVYARVSSPKQKEDLERQKQYLISDISSSINFKRSGLRSLLERSSRGLVKEVVVAHRDRLCRFAFDLIEFIFHLNSTRLVVLSNDNSTDEWELSQDVLAINTVFIC